MPFLQQFTGRLNSGSLPPAPVSLAKIGFAFRVHGGVEDGRLLRVLGDRCSIGSSPSCSLRLNLPGMQPVHCLLMLGRAGVLGRSWNSSTTLNGQPFTVSWLVGGDRLGLAGFELELLVDSRNVVEESLEPDVGRVERDALDMNEADATGDAMLTEESATDEDANWVPRRATAARINLAAMRDVANRTARVAIDQHAHRRGLQQASGKWLTALSAALTGAILTQAFPQNLVLGQVLAGGCWIMAIWWAFVGSVSYRQATLIDPQRKVRQELKLAGMSSTSTRE